MDDEGTTGQKIREIRAQLGMSLRQFAALIGMSHMSIMYWEKGRSTPCLKAVRKIQMGCRQKSLMLTIEDITAE